MRRKVLIIVGILQIVVCSAFAQNHLKIKDVFDKYGKQDGAVLVQLSTDILSQGSNIKFYKSLIVDEKDQVRLEILTALRADTDGKTIISEVKKNGQLESASYYMGHNREPINEFILYKNKGKKITIVYLKGNFPSGHLEQELKKLKDLFIYVNNKRIKIQ